MTRYRLTLLIRLAFLCLLGVAGQAKADAERPLDLFVAASLADLASELAGAFTIQTGVKVRVVPEATSTLARQIAAGAPADILLSANREWVDWLVARNPELAGKARVFASNGLVIVSVEGTPESDLEDLLAPGQKPRIAVADPDHVPAGRYARQVLTAAGLWANLAARIVPAANVRDALRLAETGQTPFAIVYESDAKVASVSVVAHLPEPDPPVAYVAVQVRTGPEAQAFVDFLGSPRAEHYLCGHGFRLPGKRQC